MPPQDKQADEIDTIMVTNMVLGAEAEVLLGLCDMLARKAGLDKIDGLPVLDWFQREKVERMDAMLIELEDTNPAIAAKFQAIIDECKKRLAQKRSGGSGT